MGKTDPEDLLGELRTAAERYEDARSSVTSIGRERVETLEATLRELDGIVATYEDRAVGTGDFEGYLAFQSEIESFVADLPEDLPHREDFEAVDEIVDKRRLSESDLAAIEERLSGPRETVDRLREVERTRASLRSARKAVHDRIGEIESRLEHLEELAALRAVDLDAPTGDLREPIDAYNDAVATAFERYLESTPAEAVLGLFDLADRYPLVQLESPPSRLMDYLEAIDEPLTVPELLEYAEYSDSKLEHYVADPDALRAAVRTDRTYLERLTPDPFTIAWPPPPADVLRWRLRELTSVVDRFADEEVIERLRAVRSLTKDAARFETLREAAEAETRLDERDRRRLTDGELASELEALREKMERLEDALASSPSP